MNKQDQNDNQDQNDYISFSEALENSFSYILYGKPISTGGMFSNFKLQNATNTKLILASVHSYRISNRCFHLPREIFLLLPDLGKKADPNDICARDNDFVWLVVENEQVLFLDAQIGSLSQILEDPSIQGIDGGVQLNNPRISNGQACVDVRVWAQIKVLGKKVGFDNTFPVCIALEGCHTVWTIDIAKLDLCFRAPNQLCAKLCAGKWGLEKCWDQCISIPIQNSGTSGREIKRCNCND